MSKISYLEFKPGRWVKLVDGEIVGPATAEEVAAWQREKTEQARIWKDVVGQAAPSESRPERPAEPPSRKGETEQVRIWQDVVRETTPSEPQAGRLSEAPSRARQPTEAEHLITEVKPKPLEPPPAFGKVDKRQATEWPIKPAVSLEPTPSTPAEPAIAAARKERPTVTRPVEVPVAEVAKAAARTAKPKPRPATKAAPAEKVTKAELRPAAKAASREQEPEARPEPTTKVAPAKKVTKPEPKPVTRAALVEKVPKAEPRPVAKAEPPKRVTKAKPELAAQVAPVEKAAKPEPKPAVKTAPLKKELKAEAGPATKPKRAPTTAPHRPAAKALPSAAEDQSSQLYLWIMAGPMDDLLAAVRSGLTRYEERFNHPAEVVLCHAEDIIALEKAELPVDVRQAKGVPPRNFWIGLK